MVKDSNSQPPSLSGSISGTPLVTVGTDASDGLYPRANEKEAVRLQSHAESSSPQPSVKRTSRGTTENTKIFDDAALTAGYESVPLLNIDTLPRGGITFETKGVGRVQVNLLTS
jgi:hypothetical protein